MRLAVSVKILIRAQTRLWAGSLVSHEWACSYSCEQRFLSWKPFLAKATRMNTYGPRDVYGLITLATMQERLTTNSLLLFLSSWIVTHLRLSFSLTYFGPHTHTKKKKNHAQLDFGSFLSRYDSWRHHLLILETLQSDTKRRLPWKDRTRILSISFAIFSSRPVT